MSKNQKYIMIVVIAVAIIPIVVGVLAATGIIKLGAEPVRSVNSEPNLTARPHP